jgi:hypothetical protein
MGLGFNHSTDEDGWSTCCPHWSYGGFQRFRRALAKAEGFDLEYMQGFTSFGGRSWDEITTDLKPLLNHSDADGELTPEECAQVYPRLKEILADWDDEFDRQAGLNLAECMLTCVAQGTKLVFC